jgi:hypothetical protein
VKTHLPQDFAQSFYVYHGEKSKLASRLPSPLRRHRKLVTIVVVLLIAAFFFLPIAREPDTVTGGSTCVGSESQMTCHQVTGDFVSASYLAFCLGGWISWPPYRVQDYQPFMLCIRPE